jgi:hypothetical protein
MTTQTHDQERPQRYGEFRFRYQDGTLAQLRQTQTFVREDDETEEHFHAHVLTWCARFDTLKQPNEYIELVETWHEDKLKRATIVVQPDEPTPTSLLHAIERVLKIVKDLSDKVAGLKKRK